MHFTDHPALHHSAREAERPPRLRKRLPQGRSLEQVWNHFRVEARLAAGLKAANRAGRRRIYESMYDELFRLVPDHPRLAKRASEAQTRRSIRNKLGLLGPLLAPHMVVAEIAPGDCRFLVELARRTRFAYGIDLSDQRDAHWRGPDNLQLIVYDGYDTGAIADHSLDLAFSDQLIEHLHPEDTLDHFRFVRRLLKPGGKYVFRTPHPYSGPHDVSAYFCDQAAGFHLKEWTYGEMAQLLAATGFRRWQGLWMKSRHRLALPHAYFRAWERALRPLPKRLERPLAKWLIPSVDVIAVADGG